MPRMLQRRFVPPPPFDAFIEGLWYWEGDPAAHAREAITASRSMGLLVDLSRNELRYYHGEDYGERRSLAPIALHGLNTQPFAIDAHHPCIMGVEFKPGGAYPFFGPAANEFRDRHVPLEDIWGAEAGRLYERLLQAPTPDDKFHLMFHALVTAAPRDFVLHPAVSLALGCFELAPHRASVCAMARTADVSTKRFIRLFSEQVGLTPKLYLRVARFQRVLQRIVHAPQIDWWDVVDRHGYYDQPHFIREFRDFSGFTPTDWLKRRGPFAHHIPLPD